MAKTKSKRWARYVARRYIGLLVGKPEGIKPLGRPRRRWKDSEIGCQREIGWGGVDWIDLAQDRDQWYLRVLKGRGTPSRHCSAASSEHSPSPHERDISSFTRPTIHFLLLVSAVRADIKRSGESPLLHSLQVM
jgi:hypothetical protein